MHVRQTVDKLGYWLNVRVRKKGKKPAAPLSGLAICSFLEKMGAKQQVCRRINGLTDMCLSWICTCLASW